MAPERWEQIERLYHSALERDAGERESFLDRACAGDADLRREIASLLAHDDSSDGFIAAPALADAAPFLASYPLMENTATLLDAPAVANEIGPYKLQTLLGKGGMGEVHLALDTRLNRKVAVKLLPAEFTQERVRRFKQEARAASALNHQNVVTIYDIGEAEGLRYLVMEYVEGETLRRRMAAAPQRMMKPVEALELAAQVAEALSAAHAAGITHRDIKPENVMIRRDGMVKVLDFGLARLTPSAGAQVDSQAPTEPKLDTASGVVMGTASYMSPEQARGLKVDQRTDIFSLGVMIYEMLAGRRPFEGATMNDVIAAILTHEPEPLGRHNKEIEPGLEQVVLKCLAKYPEKRFQTASELVGGLKSATKRGVTTGDESRRFFKSRPVWVVSMLVVLLIAAAAYWKLQLNAAPEPQIRSLAVLPLENLSGDKSQEYFADGMTESLINNLAQIRALRVISRTSVMRFKGAHKPLPEIAQELNVDAVITGSVQRAGGQVKISAQLIRAATDALLWAREYDYREMADILKLQSEVAGAIADEIRIEVTAVERAQLGAARSVKPEAYDAYQLGRFHGHKWNEDDLRQAIEYYNRAIQIDPGYAAAWAGMSNAWMQRGVWGGITFRESEAPSREAAVKAVKLDANLAEAHVALSRIKYHYENDWSGAEQEAKLALEIDPGGRDANHAYANLLMALGRHDEAIRKMQIVALLDPLSSETQSSLGRVLYRAGKYEEAERRLKQAIDLDSRNYSAYGRLGDLYEQMRRYPEAIISLEKAEKMRKGGRPASYLARLARAYAMMGKREEARRMLKEIKATTESDRLPLHHMATAYTALGDKDEAFKLLFRLIDERNGLIMYIKEDPPLANLHSDPRWKEALRRMNFPEE